MKNSILKIEGVHTINKNQQKSIHGGLGFVSLLLYNRCCAGSSLPECADIQCVMQ